MPSFQFGNVVVVHADKIGVVVKSWADGTHDVYVRSYNSAANFPSTEIKHYVYSKELSEDEKQFYGA